tara:strand:+ start:614 stop:1138 length:525 start_codon:yes stop_codon:yes gene_type:complete
MKKKFFLAILILIFLKSFSFSFEFGSSPDTKDIGTGGKEDLSFMNIKTSNLRKGKDFLKKGVKYSKKNKFKKANKSFEKALSYFVLAYKRSPESVEILNYLGLTYNFLEDLMMSEIYYQEGLSLDPKHPIINQKLGELYFRTKRIDLARERLNVLKSCNCDEFLKLKNVIATSN